MLADIQTDGQTRSSIQLVCFTCFMFVLMQGRRSQGIIGRGDIKEDWRSGGRCPSGVHGRAPVGGLVDEVPQKLKLFL